MFIEGKTANILMYIFLKSSILIPPSTNNIHGKPIKVKGYINVRRSL